MDKVAFNAEAVRIIDDRLTALRRLTFAEAAALPEASSESTVVAGNEARIKVFRKDDAYQLDGKILLVVMVGKLIWFGMGSHQIDRGLVFSPDQPVRDATDIELLYSGG